MQFWSINETDIDPDELRRFKREYDVKQIINFLSGLSKRLKSVDVMKMRSERARRVNDSYQTLERKIKEVFNRVDKLLVAHMRFYYTDKVVGERSHQKVKSDWHIFLQGKDPLSPVCSAIGYFWKLEWSNEFGWYYQYTLFLDGEKCIKKVSLALSSVVVRPADLVARYGGEEFIVLLPNTELEGAVHIAELNAKLTFLIHSSPAKCP